MLEIDEHLCVAGVFPQEKEETLHCFNRLVSSQGTTDQMDLVQPVFRQDKFLPARAGLQYIYSGIDVLLRDAAIENEFHVARPFEFLKDQIVHTTVRFDQGSGDYR